MTNVETFIHSLPDNQRILCLKFHQYLTDELGLVSKIRHRIPFYYGRTWICYLNPVKGDGVELAFIRGNELSNESGVLEYKDRKQVGGITVFDMKQIPWAQIHELVQEAIILDETVPYTIQKNNGSTKS